MGDAAGVARRLDRYRGVVAMAQCTDLFDSTVRLALLAIDLPGAQLARSPALIAKALQSKAVQDAIRAALLEQAKQLLQEQRKGGADPSAQSARLLSSLQAGTGNAALKDLERQVKASSSYEKLLSAVDDLNCAYKESPVGVWVNENEGWLIVAAAGIAFGSAAAMYYTRQGDKPAEWFGDLLKTHFRVKNIGRLKEAGLNDFTFIPSRREFNLKGFARADFQSVQASLEVQMATTEGRMMSGGASGEVVVPINARQSVSARGGFRTTRTASGGAQTDYDLGLGFSIREEKGKGSALELSLAAAMESRGGAVSMGGSAAFKYATPAGAITASGSVKAPVGAGSAAPEYKVLGGIEWSF